MKQTLRVFTVLISLLLLLPLLTSCSQQPEVKSVSKIPSAFKDTSNEDTVIVIGVDRNNNHKVNEQSVLDGQDAILVYIQKDPNNSKQKYDMFYFNQNHLLHELDQQHHGMIDPSNPAFQHLYLLTFSNDGSKRFIIPIYEAGIRAIFLPKQDIEKAMKKHHTFNFLSDANHVLMADGSTRQLITVQIEPKYLQATQDIQTIQNIQDIQ